MPLTLDNHHKKPVLSRSWWYKFDGQSQVVIGQFEEISEGDVAAEAIRAGFLGPFDTQTEALMAGIAHMETFYEELLAQISKGEKETHGESKFIN